MMHRVVWKYTLAGVAELQIPEGARFLHCAEQHGEVALWFEVDQDRPPVARRFSLLLTGELINSRGDWGYLGTVLLRGGHFVVHVYEEGTQHRLADAAGAIRELASTYSMTGTDAHDLVAIDRLTQYVADALEVRR
jgi:hypothetical protein